MKIRDYLDEDKKPEDKKPDLPFEPDIKPKAGVVVGKRGYGPAMARHLARQGMKSVREWAEEVELEEAKVYDPFTKKMVARKPIKVQAGGGATRNGVPVETGASNYKTKLPMSKAAGVLGAMEEASLGNHAGLLKYSNNLSAHYAADKRDFEKAAEHMRTGNRDALKKHLHGLATDVKHKIIHHIGRAHLGQDLLGEETEQIDELSRDTLKSYVNKREDQLVKKFDGNVFKKAAVGDKEALKTVNQHKSTMVAQRKIAKKNANAYYKEEVEELDEIHPSIMAMAKVAGHQSLRAQADKHTEAALKANKAGDDEKVRYHQAQVAKIKAKMQNEEQSPYVLSAIQELSKKTLGSYVKKASSDIADRHYRIHSASRPYPGESKADFEKDISKAFDLQRKRKTGMDKALDKLTKEEENLAELKASTLQSYSDKAHQQALDATYDAAHLNRPGEEKFKADAKKLAAKRAGGVQRAQTKLDRKYNAAGDAYRAHTGINSNKLYNKEELEEEIYYDNIDLFLEALMSPEVRRRMASHEKFGHKVSDQASRMKNGEMEYSFVVTQPSGKRSRHIYHGSKTRHETMSPAPKSKEAHEVGDDEDDK